MMISSMMHMMNGSVNGDTCPIILLSVASMEENVRFVLYIMFGHVVHYIKKKKQRLTTVADTNVDGCC